MRLEVSVLIKSVDAYLYELFQTTMKEYSTMQIIIDLLLNLNTEASKEQVRLLYEEYLEKISTLLEFVGVANPQTIAKLLLSTLDGLMYLNMVLGKNLTGEENEIVINALKCIINLEEVL